MTGTFTNINNELNEFIKKQKNIENIQYKKIADLSHKLTAMSNENEKLETEKNKLSSFIDLIYEYMEEQYKVTSKAFTFALETFQKGKELFHNQIDYIVDEFNEFKRKNKSKGKDINER